MRKRAGRSKTRSRSNRQGALKTHPILQPIPEIHHRQEPRFAEIERFRHEIIGGKGCFRFAVTDDGMGRLHTEPAGPNNAGAAKSRCIMNAVIHDEFRHEIESESRIPPPGMGETDIFQLGEYFDQYPLQMDRFLNRIIRDRAGLSAENNTRAVR